MLKLILLVIVLLLEWYLLMGLKIFSARPVLSVSYGMISLAGLLSLSILLFGQTRTMDQGLINLLLAAIFIVFMSKIVAAGFLLIDDIRRLIVIGLGQQARFDPGRSQFMRNLAVLMGGIPFLLLGYGVVRNPYRYQLIRKKIGIDSLPESLRGLRIVQISDIHAGSLTRTKPVKEAVRLINDIAPDLVFFTGDLVNNFASEMDPFVDIFREIKSRYGVFSVLGNHDYGDYVSWDSTAAKMENHRMVEEVHHRMGWKLLRNESEEITVGDHRISVIGVENFSALARFPKYGDLEKAYRDNSTDLKLLLTHDPSHWDYEVNHKYNDIAITFSGHTHGFQFGVEIPGFVRWSPSQYVYKQWAGLYRKGAQYLYVNRGFGFLAYPGRVGILPEISLIELDKSA